MSLKGVSLTGLVCNSRSIVAAITLPNLLKRIRSPVLWGFNLCKNLCRSVKARSTPAIPTNFSGSTKGCAQYSEARFRKSAWACLEGSFSRRQARLADGVAHGLFLELVGLAADAVPPDPRARVRRHDQHSAERPCRSRAPPPGTKSVTTTPSEEGPPYS
jgi:hypothetical protein